MKKIVLIQTGGTIAMSAKGAGVELDPEEWSQLLVKNIPELHELAEIHAHPLFFEDSSDLNPTHWVSLANCIEQNYDIYDGFVVLHGTDTMAYTASALSFALQNLAKPVIFTGSQVPMSNIRSDARRNLVNAIEMATTSLSEVAICFNDHVFRGNRTTKMSINDFNAFTSPNFPPLAEIGLNITFRVMGKTNPGKFLNKAAYNNEVFIFTVHPGMNTHFLSMLDFSNIKAVIIRAFGSGNFPIKGEHSLLPFLQTCREQGVIVVIVSQANFDAVDLTKYSSGKMAIESGAISGIDMTLESALTKLMFLLAHYSSKKDIEQKFRESLAGELTV